MVTDNIEITISLADNNQIFSSLETFNAFDFRFWLISNNGFSEERLNIVISYTDINNNNVSQTIIICLQPSETILDDTRGENKPDFVTLDVFFGTDRDDTKSKDLNDRFGVKRSFLKYGVVGVSIPHDHRVGEIESPSIWKFEFSEDPSKHIMLQEVRLLERRTFFKKLARDIASSNRKSTFLFVHGYNTSFSEAAKRTAQISYDLKFDGKAVFYSWPSQASTFRYGRDEKNIEWSRKNIKFFFSKLYLFVYLHLV